MSRRTVRLLRALVSVLLVDASATSALVVAAWRARARRSGASLVGVAVVATASLLPGITAVIREVHAHRSQKRATHSMRPTALLLLGGVLIATTGTLLVLPATGPVAGRGASARRADLLLLVGGNLIGVPYAAIVSALHADARDRPQGRAEL